MIIEGHRRPRYSHPGLGSVAAIAFVMLVAACTSPDVTPSASTSPPTSASASVIQPPATGPQPVIVDYSPTVSDVGALLYLLSHPNVDVLAITLPVTGEAGCELGIEVTLGILAMYERDDVPVACDPAPAENTESWPAEFLRGHESLAFGLPAPLAEADQRVAHQLIADVAASSDQPATLYAVAPLTNVARALDQHPDLAEQLGGIVIMGGAVDAPGNVGVPDAEWNFFIDVAAASQVLASEAAVTLVPLDATDHVPVPGFWQRDLEAAEQTEPIQYLTSLVRIFPDVTSGFFYLWDELAASVAAGEDTVISEVVRLAVVQKPGATYGNTVRDPSGAPVSVALTVPEPTGFYAHFLSTLSGAPVRAPVPLRLDEASAPSTVLPTSPSEVVVSYWLINGVVEGDVEAAASVVAPDAAWIGFGASPHVFVEGSGPFAAFDSEVTCTSDGAIAFCEITWNDLWVAAIPELERGGAQIQAEVADGLIVAFEEFAFNGDTAAAFRSHSAWLESEHPERHAAACGADPASKDCSQLFVDTVEEWVANR